MSKTHILITKDSSWGEWHLGFFYMEEGSSGFIVTEEVFLFNFISSLKLSNYWHYK